MNKDKNATTGDMIGHRTADKDQKHGRQKESHHGNAKFRCPGVQFGENQKGEQNGLNANGSKPADQPANVKVHGSHLVCLFMMMRRPDELRADATGLILA